MAKVTEAEAAEYIASLFRAEQDGTAEKAQITMGPATAFVAIGAWQLAMRHPDFSDLHHHMIGHLIGQLTPLFAGTLGEEILELGNHPEHDRPSRRRAADHG